MSSTPGHPSPPAFPGLPLPSPSDVGHVPPDDRRGIWPAHPDFLTDTTRCPSCFTALTASSFAPAESGSAGPVCLSCGLDLSGPEAADVFDVGTGIVEAESRRQRILGQMRAGQAARDAARAAAYHAAAQHSQAPSPGFSTPPTPTPAGYPAPLSAWYPPQSAPPLPPAGQPSLQEPALPRRSGVQILMLTVGVILVSIMAIFFVLLAYLIASLEVRSVLTGVASFAVFGVAWLLHRRRLSGTAQGIAVLAVVLLLLDLWIIRANDLFGSGGIDGWLYSGLATGALAGLLALGFRVLPLRSLSLAAVLLAPFAVFAVTLGILSNAEATTSSWAALTAVGAAALAWPLIRFGSLERGVVRGIGFLAAALAIFPASFAFPGPDAGPVLSLLVLAFVWFGHLLVSPTPTPTADALPGSADTVPAGRPDAAAPRTSLMQVLSALGLGLTVAAIGPAVWFRLPELSMSLWAPAAITLAGAVVLALVARLLASRSTLLQISAVVPLAIGAFAALPAAVVTLSQFVAVLTARPFTLAVVDDIPGVLPEYRWTVALALALVTVLMASVFALLNRLRTAGWVPSAFGALGLVAACFALATPALTGLGLLVVAIAGLLATVSPRLAGPYRLISAVGAALATLGLFVVGLTSTVTFPFSVLATVALLVTFREVVRRVLIYSTARWLTPIVLVALVTVLLVGLRLLPVWMQAVTGVTSSPTGPALLLSLSALTILAAVPLTTAILTRFESATVAAVTVLPLGLGLVELSSRIPVDAVPFLVACGITAAIGILWQLVRGVANWPERYVAALATPPLVVLFAAVLSDQFDPSATPLLASAVVVVLAGIALMLFRPAARPDVPQAPSQIARVGWDATLALSAVPLLVAAVAGNDLGWVALLLTAVAALIIASGEGGVFRGQSPRRHVAWAGLPLAIGALWLALARNDVTGLEFYTMPVAGVLLALLALIAVRRALPTDGSGRTTLFGAAVAVALLPSATAADSVEPLRGALVIGVAIGLLIGGPFLSRTFRGIRLAAVIWLGGAAASVLTVVVLAFRGDPDGWQNETVAAALLVGGLLWLHRTQAPRAFGTAAIALSPVLLGVSVSIAMVSADVELWRFLPVLVVISALSAVATLPRLRVPLVRWAALTSAVLVAAVGITTGVADPFEIATAPIAVALLVGGALRMAADPAARSWPSLGAGVLLLLVPSLMADLGSTELWRILALGVVALGVFGAGLALKLSAPTWVGAAVLVIHGLAQLWPWISGLYGAVPWWLWAGIGGVVLIFFAATYERRIRDLRTIARSISSLR